MMSDLMNIFADAEVISIYSDGDALDDGIICNTSGWLIFVNNLVINRMTTNALYRLGEIYNLTPQTGLVSKISELIGNRKVAEDEDADFIVIEDPLKIWILPNETGGLTLMLPSDY